MSHRIQTQKGTRRLYSHSERNPVLTVSSVTRKRQPLPRARRIMFSSEWIELNPARSGTLSRQHQARAKLQLALHLPPPALLRLRRPPRPLLLYQHLFPPLHSTPAPGASCCAALGMLPEVLDCEIKRRFLYFLLLCIICVRRIINLLQCNTIWKTVLAGHPS